MFIHNSMFHGISWDKRDVWLLKYRLYTRLSGKPNNALTCKDFKTSCPYERGKTSTNGNEYSVDMGVNQGRQSSYYN